MEVFTLAEGASPFILSSPHSGTFVPDDIRVRLTEIAGTLPDTDWHVDRLYDRFAQAEDVTFIKANYSRYVVDLNRPPDNTPLYPGQAHVPLCPDKTFAGDEIYQPSCAPSEDEIAARIERYWRPYHDELTAQIERVKAQHGYAVLYDCHSIRARIPRLFEGQLPDLNIGTAGGKSCSKNIGRAAFEVAQKSGYSAVLNGRFIGGYITRHYGRPEQNVHAVQMEIAQHTHIDENTYAYDESKAGKLRSVLERILHAIADNAGAGVKAEAIG